MRKANGIITAAILVLFLIHAVSGAFQLIGAGNIANRVITWSMAALVAVHAVIGTLLTVQSVRIQKKTGAYYFRQNALFWARRISGFALLVFLVFHAMAFQDRSAAVFRLIPFDSFRLATQIALVICLAVHIISNAKPALITFGIPGLKKWAADICVILSVILIAAAAAFIVYYLRWMSV